MDFTLSIYHKLLTTLQDKGFVFQPFLDFLERPAGRVVTLRHDVDKLPANALKMAILEHGLGIRGTYYFRCVKASWDEPVMRQLAEMGHEIGYHYEDLSLANGDHRQAIRHFEQQLSRLREIYPVKTICMHGSPLSNHDNRDLWKHYNYRDYGIIGEPYFDVDFSRVLYLTDTGRRWDGGAVSVRDKIVGSREKVVGRKRYRSTKDIIKAANEGRLPEQIMITVHPQRWTDRFGPWLWELVWQNMKNVVKRVLVGRRTERRKV